jgi:bifunctional UDP-N-acetylglucosamine pyrophosphorylase/glucosamine-1-phosphate N-acetyltransferase
MNGMIPRHAQPALQVLVLAAGRGTRMRSARPKVLQPLGGRPLLWHVLEQARQLAPAAITVVVGHQAAEVQAAAEAMAADLTADLAESGGAPIPLRFVEQVPQRGTGHAVALGIDGLPASDTVLILYGDVPRVPLADLQACLSMRTVADLVILGAHVEQPTGYGRLLEAASGAVVGIVEERDATPEQKALRCIHTGILCAPVGHLRRWLHAVESLAHARQGEWYLTDVVAAAHAEGAVLRRVLSVEAADVLGVNDRIQLAAQERRYQRAQATQWLQQGLTLLDPERFDVRGKLVFGEDCVCDVNVVMEGTVILGKRVVIGPHCLLRDVTLGDDVRIEASSVLEGCVVEAAAVVGPFARLRPGTRLGPGARVGNFVELKNTRLGAAAKANHLSYLGDAEVGPRANIGAGTITCNYDGVHKHRTEIGADAFIGSNSALVAPVSVGHGATLGAGTVLTRSAPPDALTLTRTPQKTLPHWPGRRKTAPAPPADPAEAPVAADAPASADAPVAVGFPEEIPVK